MKKIYILIGMWICLVFISCENKTAEEASKPETACDSVEIGKYYQDGDITKPYVEIISEQAIDVSHADIELMMEALEEIRAEDFPDDTEEERKAYLTKARDMLSLPYDFETTQAGNVIKLRILEFDGEFLAITMEYNAVDNLLVWGDREFILSP